MLIATVLLMMQGNQPNLLSKAKLVCVPQKWAGGSYCAWYSDRKLFGMTANKEEHILIDAETGVVEPWPGPKVRYWEDFVPSFQKWIIDDRYDEQQVTRRILNAETQEVRSEWKFTARSHIARVLGHEKWENPYASISEDGKWIYEIEMSFSEPEPYSVYIQRRNIDCPTQVEIYPTFKHLYEYCWVDVVGGVAEFDTHPTVLPLFNPLNSKKIKVNSGLGGHGRQEQAI